jgi:hypothetical protein
MSTIKTNTLQNVAGTLSVPVGTVVNGSAKAWVNFNGTGTVAIRAGFNVSSITDNGVGDYTVNFTTTMADANYAVTTCAQLAADNLDPPNYVYTGVRRRSTAVAVGGVRVFAEVSDTRSQADPVQFYTAIFR